MKASLPHGGEWIKSPNRRFEEPIIFVPFFGAKRTQLRRHVDLVGALGYDCIQFDVSFDRRWLLKKIPFSRSKKIGLKHLWSDEIEDVLNAVSGPKILFCFSNPSSSAIEALARRDKRDVNCVVFDSGPFLHFQKCTWNLLKYHYKIPLSLRLPALAVATAGWALDHESSLKADLKKLPTDLPLLSIRGWEDLIVPIFAIEAAFNSSPHLRPEVVSLPEVGHLEGLKNAPENYKNRVESFLSRFATPLKKN